jgi:RNA polymerase sigma-70 factor, ECF subfamily
MITAEVSGGPTSVNVVESGKSATIPVPLARGPIDGVAPSSGGLRESARDLPKGPLAGGAARRELLDGFLAGAVRGDCRARDDLLALIHPLVLRYCRARLGRQESVLGSADDVAHDVCMAVVDALPSYQLKGLSFQAFVYGIAAHKVADVFRALGRDRSESMAELPDSPATLEGPEDRVLAGERAERLGALLAQLTARQREVLVLRLAVGVSAEETAEAVGSTPGAVRVSQHRALARLRRILQEGEAGRPPFTDSAPGDAAAEVAPK